MTEMNDATARSSTALIVVDVQNDFVDGSLATGRGAAVASLITDHLRATTYGVVVGTKDWHIDPEGHFAPEGEEPDFVTTWPVHCVAGSRGAQPHANLDTDLIEQWFLKGEYTAAYSGFEAHRDPGVDTARDGDAASDQEVLLGEWLRSAGITDVVVCGIATEFCVRATALDACEQGFGVTVMRELCSPVNPDASEGVFHELSEAGARVQ
ncbi:isochorismatase family protein [Corynebacterium sp. zg254]|uniref:nicotinamidase n=1 Tax=Corynebacterium zhongnanshanii TaxID=2768834 RepID=A0ABQ6VFZ7_9CORY|nr:MULTISPECIES: isochorismatase family protein [Corynebacterium]KAB3523119.1 isochorismatase family protein [Corynebacterium zhongnanshanii]MCR5913778.1 isochorismatase family protein [Corynebacterium sp. zg254]